jgi:transglutaminase-like putative cysteine protease
LTHRARNRAQAIIVEKQNQWTKNLGRKKSRIAIFEHIRDIPYAIVAGLGDPVQGPAKMLAQNRGYCEPKHIVMFMMYQKLEIPVKYLSYPFRWSAQDVDYPWKLMKLADGMPMGYHLACKACINGRWILVDATWDLPLKKLGFPVNEGWDGISDTLNAVKPEEEIIHENDRERLEYIRRRRWGLLTEKEKALSRRFFDELNKWLQEVRD